MLAKELNDGNLFEREVRSIARELWPSAQYHGSQLIGGRERDGVFHLEDSIHCLECTVSRDEKKTRGDLDKLSRLIDDLRKDFPKKSIKGWFVTLHEPTAEQGRHILNKKFSINHETFDRFRSKLIDASEFLNLRMRYPFGSARNISDNSIDIPQDEYIESHLFPDDKTKPLGISQIAKTVVERNKRYVIFGEYGVGKSMTLRQLFIELFHSYMSGAELRFPLYVNLRDHREISDISDALRQHARSLGYKDESHLVRAFRAGYTILILDGFDEAPPRIGSRDLTKARELRRSALALVRRFVREAPARTPIIIAGRSNFFDNAEEIQEALGIDRFFTHLSITEFSDNQIMNYLKKKGTLNTLPLWLPRKPLLIGYFVTRNLAALLASGTAEQDIGVGWRSLIVSICDREVSQIEIGIYASELVSLYGRIATKARKKLNKLGPVTFNEMREAFRELFGIEPEDRALTALLRLPGLASGSMDSGGKKGEDVRWFVDDSFVDAVAAADMLPIIREIYSDKTEIYRGVRHQLSGVGVSVAAALCRDEHIEESQILSSLIRIEQKSPDSVVAIDLLQIARECGLKSLNRIVVLIDQFVEELYLNIDECDLSMVSINDSYFRKAYIDAEDIRDLPSFSQCYFGEIRTPLSLESLNNRLNDCQIEKLFVVEPPSLTNVDDVRIGVMRSVLDKLFVQSSSGREERAFTRGVPQQAQVYVQPIIDILRKEGFCFRRTFRGTPIWYPVRGRFSEAWKLIENTDGASNEVMAQVVAL